MKKWFGSSGVCINELGQLLMVLQGGPGEKQVWSIPSGGKENGETFEECCIREIEEETGYRARILEEIIIKRVLYKELNIAAEIHYFLALIVGGRMKVQDPDCLIYDIDWKCVNEIKTLQLTFPEDREFLIQCLLNHPA